MQLALGDPGPLGSGMLTSEVGISAWDDQPHDRGVYNLDANEYQSSLIN